MNTSETLMFLYSLETQAFLCVDTTFESHWCFHQIVFDPIHTAPLAAAEGQQGDPSLQPFNPHHNDTINSKTSSQGFQLHSTHKPPLPMLVLSVDWAMQVPSPARSWRYHTFKDTKQEQWSGRVTLILNHGAVKGLGMATVVLFPRKMVPFIF